MLHAEITSRWKKLTIPVVEADVLRAHRLIEPCYSGSLTYHLTDGVDWERIERAISQLHSTRR